MYICECGREFNTFKGLSIHQRYCVDIVGEEKSNEYIDKCHHHRRSKEEIYDDELIKIKELEEWIAEEHTCEICGRVMTEKYGSGRFCSERCKQKFCASFVNNYPGHNKGKTWHQKAWNEGLTKETDERVMKISTSLKNSESFKESNSIKMKDVNIRNKISLKLIERFRNGSLTISSKAGHGKKSYIIYKGKKICLRSTYEFIYSLYLLYNKIDFEYETVKVPGISGKYIGHTFRSDFLLSDNKIVEVKGWFTDKVIHEKIAFENAGYSFEIKYWKDIKPCLDYLREIKDIDIDDLLNKVKIGSDSKEYFVFNFDEQDVLKS